MFKTIKKLFTKTPPKQPAKQEPKTIGDLVREQMEYHIHCSRAADNVIVFLCEGKKVNAIKAVRQATGSGLKEAKALVDTGLNQRFSRDDWIHEITDLKKLG